MILFLYKKLIVFASVLQDYKKKRKVYANEVYVSHRDSRDIRRRFSIQQNQQESLFTVEE